MAVGVAQRVGDLARDLERGVQRELLLAREPAPQRLPLHVGHDVVEEAPRVTGVVERQDVGVVEPGGGLDLAQEPVRAHLGGQLRAQHLERHPPVVPEVLGQEHHRHAPCAQLTVDAVVRG